MGRLVEERFDRQLAINQPLVPCVSDETLEILAVAGQVMGDASVTRQCGHDVCGPWPPRIGVVSLPVTSATQPGDRSTLF
jgi:hypothetical protein